MEGKPSGMDWTAGYINVEHCWSSESKWLWGKISCVPCMQPGTSPRVQAMEHLLDASLQDLKRFNVL